MTAPQRQQALAGLLRGVSDDLAAGPALLALLDQQFEAALGHRSAELGELAARLNQALEAMEGRRAQRVALAQSLLGADATMAAVRALLKGATRARLDSEWQQLEQLVLACRSRSARNANLLTEQYSIMQRVLHGDEQIYAPA